MAEAPLIQPPDSGIQLQESVYGFCETSKNRYTFSQPHQMADGSPQLVQTAV